ncbi:MAG: xanthine dehydrogenase family protein molybdopterin-binding subunit [Actinomycetota bacterium]
MTTSIFGSVLHRSEDPRFLTGAGRYVENIPIDGALAAVFVRSMMAHARISGVDGSEAIAMPGVVGVFSSGDLDLPLVPPSGDVPEVFSHPHLAGDTVRFVGEPIAVVVAETRAQAADAAEALLVDYEPLPVVVGVEAGLAREAPLLFPEHGGNVASTHEKGWDEDVLEGAEVIVRGRVVNQRLAPTPLEVNAAAAVPADPEGGLTVYVSTQIPFDVRNDVADALGLPKAKVRVIAPDVGGGFGAKLTVYPEYVILSAIAMRLERPVRWVESRSESMVGLTHGRAQVHDFELGARRDGTIVGLRLHVIADMGAYPIAAYLPANAYRMASGTYRIPRIAFKSTVVVTNATPVAPYRGAGRPEPAALLERSLDLLAGELGLDPVDVRRRNLIPADAFPYKTATGTSYDTGDYVRALDEALRLAGYETLRKEQAERRALGSRRRLGIGVCTYVEMTAFSGREHASVDVGPDGAVTVLAGTSPQGQGHETAFAQLASGLLGMPFESVRVVHSDTGLVPKGEGTYGSRSLQVGGSAVWRASEEVLEKARRLAAHLLEAAVEDVVPMENGRIGVAGAPESALTWAELARGAADPARLPTGMEPGLSASVAFTQRDFTFPFGAHVAVVEVDIETGDARLIRHVAVDDCGRILNPMLVAGQVHGGLAQGIAQALYEAVEYDEAGTPLTSNLATYAMPSAAELPRFETAHTETPTPLNPLGAKGIGESATIGSTPAVQSAVVDALSHLGVRHIDMPLSPERVWRAIREARVSG